jgi:hypothetical protein
MLTLQDCIELSELTKEEILAIARHEHIPEIAALELGHYLVQTPEGKLLPRLSSDRTSVFACCATVPACMSRLRDG